MSILFKCFDRTTVSDITRKFYSIHKIVFSSTKVLKKINAKSLRKNVLCDFKELTKWSSLGEIMTMLFLHQLLAFVLKPCLIFKSPNKKWEIKMWWVAKYNPIYMRSIFRQLSNDPYHLSEKKKGRMEEKWSRVLTPNNTTSVLEVTGRS